MTERVTTLDFTPWASTEELNLFMETDFSSTLPAANGIRYTLPVDNRVKFSPEESVVSGTGFRCGPISPFCQLS